MRFLFVIGILALYFFLSFIPSSGTSPLKALLNEVGKKQQSASSQSAPMVLLEVDKGDGGEVKEDTASSL